MFSLIITIIAIALVAALAVATIYYGGDTANKASVKATAATVVNQAHQLLGANQIFHSQFGRFPDSPEELVEKGFLTNLPQTPKQIAFAGTGTPAITPAFAEGEVPPWSQVQTRAPQYWILKSANQKVCQAINLQSRGDNGIRLAAREGLAVQCFGPAAPFTVLVHNHSAFRLSDTVPAAAPDLSVDPDSPWVVEPSESAPVAGGGTTPPNNPRELVATPDTFNIDGMDSTGSSYVRLCTTAPSDYDFYTSTVTIGGKPSELLNDWTEASGHQCIAASATPNPAGTVPVVISTADNGVFNANLRYIEDFAAGPQVLSFTPAVGPSNETTQVTIQGSGFESGVKVLDYYSSIPLATTMVDSTTLHVTVPAASALGFSTSDLQLGYGYILFQVENKDSTASYAGQDFLYEYVPPPPTPLANLKLTPGSGSVLGNYFVTLTGDGLSEETGIFSCPNVECQLSPESWRVEMTYPLDANGKTSLRFKMPRGDLENPDNEFRTLLASNNGGQDFVMVPFTYTQSQPTITSLSRSSAYPDEAPITLDVYGTGFEEFTDEYGVLQPVLLDFFAQLEGAPWCQFPQGNYWNWVSVPATFINSTHLKVTLPAPEAAFTDNLCRSMKVHNFDGGRNELAEAFTFINRPPVCGTGMHAENGTCVADPAPTPPGGWTVETGVTFFGNWSASIGQTELLLTNNGPSSCLAESTISAQNVCMRDYFQAQLGSGASCSVSYSNAAPEVVERHPSALKQEFLQCTGATQANVAGVAANFTEGYRVN